MCKGDGNYYFCWYNIADYTINVPTKGDPVVTSELDVSFTNLTNEFTVADANITAYFVDDGNLPYLDIQSFMLLLNGLFYSDELTFTPNGDLLVISYEVTDEESNELITIVRQ